MTDASRPELRARGGCNSSVQARQAFEASLDPALGGLHRGVSHEGTTAATITAMRAARHAAPRPPSSRPDRAPRRPASLIG